MVSLFRVRTCQQMLVVAGLSLGASGVIGCRTSCDDAVDPKALPYDGGHTDVSGRYYESGSEDEAWLKFPPERVFEFTHQLRWKPFAIVPYVSFGPCPHAPSTCPDEGRPTDQAAPAAGDIATLSDVTDHSFQVHNNTCETFWLRVVAFSADFGGAPGTGGSSNAAAGAGGAGGAP